MSEQIRGVLNIPLVLRHSCIKVDQVTILSIIGHSLLGQTPDQRVKAVAMKLRQYPENQRSLTISAEDEHGRLREFYIAAETVVELKEGEDEVNRL